ncbi:MAG: DUF559 domain-containing protein [Balneolaceae bacterium]|nr:DUF559 domain-containing protein [Balneolaceae bacterium]
MEPTTITNNPGLDQTQTKCNWSNSQTILWQHLKEGKMLGFHFGRHEAVDQYVLDFYSPELRLGIELNAYSEPMDSLAVKEIQRENLFKASGIKLVRFWEDDIMYDLENVLSMIEMSVHMQRRKLRL